MVDVDDRALLLVCSQELTIELNYFISVANRRCQNITFDFFTTVFLYFVCQSFCCVPGLNVVTIVRLSILIT